MGLDRVPIHVTVYAYHSPVMITSRRGHLAVGGKERGQGLERAQPDLKSLNGNRVFDDVYIMYM